ncbi:hypothetical protein TNCV_4273051 [Trichonephila clavipes]|nr:hypothetical protein TNCV_4273051 [Trichonephila clavipes]
MPHRHYTSTSIHAFTGQFISNILANGMWSVAKSPRVAEQCDVNLHSLTHLPMAQQSTSLNSIPNGRQKTARIQLEVSQVLNPHQIPDRKNDLISIRKVLSRNFLLAE